MKKIFALLTLFLCIPVHADDGQGNYAIWGVGAKSCYRYTEARKNDDYGEYTAYLMGYLTAINALSPNTFRVSGKMNINEIIEWIDNHCDLQKVDGFEHAISVYITTHLETRLKHSPRSNQLK